LEARFLKDLLNRIQKTFFHDILTFFSSSYSFCYDVELHHAAASGRRANLIG